MITATFLFPEVLKPEARPLIWESWTEPLQNHTAGRGLTDYRFVSVATIVIFATLYFIFR